VSRMQADRSDFYGCRLGSKIPTDREAEAELDAVISFLRPKPSPYPLIRIGGHGDGAYLVPDDLHGVRACFSPGVADRKHFEDQLAEDYGIASHLCDYSTDAHALKTPLRQGLQTFEKKWLDVNGAPDSHSLDEWVAARQPHASDDLILQIDIEGAEYRNLMAADDATLRRMRIVVVELHGLRCLRFPAVVHHVLGPFFARLSQHFVCVHAHPNNCSSSVRLPVGHKPGAVSVPDVLELTLLRQDRFSMDGQPLPLIQPALPHPLDIVNVPVRPPDFLDMSWLDGDRSVASKVKILEDRVAYLERRMAQEVEERVLHVAECLRNALLPFHDPNPAAVDEELESLCGHATFHLSDSIANHPRTGQLKDRTPYIFHTKLDTNQRVTLDLGRACEMHWLLMRNRTDGFQKRARLLFWVAHDTPQGDLSRGRPVAVDGGFLSGGESTSRSWLGRVEGRYLTLFSPMSTAIHLSSVDVMGRPLPGSARN